MDRKLRMGMVGGGPGAFIGEVHRKAARFACNCHRPQQQQEEERHHLPCAAGGPPLPLDGGTTPLIGQQRMWCHLYHRR